MNRSAYVFLLFLLFISLPEAIFGQAYLYQLPPSALADFAPKLDSSKDSDSPSVWVQNHGGILLTDTWVLDEDSRYVLFKARLNEYWFGPFETEKEWMDGYNALVNLVLDNEALFSAHNGHYSIHSFYLAAGSYTPSGLGLAKSGSTISDEMAIRKGEIMQELIERLSQQSSEIGNENWTIPKSDGDYDYQKIIENWDASQEELKEIHGEWMKAQFGDVFEAQMRNLMPEMEGIVKEMEEVRNGLNQPGRVGPSQPEWGDFSQALSGQNNRGGICLNEKGQLTPYNPIETLLLKKPLNGFEEVPIVIPDIQYDTGGFNYTEGGVIGDPYGDPDGGEQGEGVPDGDKQGEEDPDGGETSDGDEDVQPHDGAENGSEDGKAEVANGRKGIFQAKHTFDPWFAVLLEQVLRAILPTELLKLGENALALAYYIMPDVIDQMVESLTQLQRGLFPDNIDNSLNALANFAEKAMSFWQDAYQIYSMVNSPGFADMVKSMSLQDIMQEVDGTLKLADLELPGPIQDIRDFLPKGMSFNNLSEALSSADMFQEKIQEYVQKEMKNQSKKWLDKNFEKLGIPMNLGSIHDLIDGKYKGRIGDFAQDQMTEAICGQLKGYDNACEHLIKGEFEEASIESAAELISSQTGILSKSEWKGLLKNTKEGDYQNAWKRIQKAGSAKLAQKLGLDRNAISDITEAIRQKDERKVIETILKAQPYLGWGIEEDIATILTNGSDEEVNESLTNIMANLTGQLANKSPSRVKPIIEALKQGKPDKALLKTLENFPTESGRILGISNSPVLGLMADQLSSRNYNGFLDLAKQIDDDLSAKINEIDSLLKAGMSKSDKTKLSLEIAEDIVQSKKFNDAIGDGVKQIVVLDDPVQLKSSVASILEGQGIYADYAADITDGNFQKYIDNWTSYILRTLRDDDSRILETGDANDLFLLKEVGYVNTPEEMQGRIAHRSMVIVNGLQAFEKRITEDPEYRRMIIENLRR